MQMEKEVQYFIELVNNNLKRIADKPQGISKEEMLFFNWSISPQGKEITVYQQEKDELYEIPITNIQKEDVLAFIEAVKQYLRKEVSFQKVINKYQGGIGYGI